MESKHSDIFYQVHEGLPREAPGCLAATRQAFLLSKLPANARILDIGCGPGKQTLDLAELAPDARIDAIDLHPGYVKEARKRVIDQNLSHRITITQADMSSMPFAAESFDLIWCEGAAYVIGVSKALELWRPFLKPLGILAYSDLVWLSESPPESIQTCWKEAYPDMQLIQGRNNLAKQHGYTNVGNFLLPESAWWQDFYTPMELRIEMLREKHSSDPGALKVLDTCQEEIDNYRQFSEYYGYAFFVLKPSV